MDPDNYALEEKLRRYKFYHCIQLAPDVTTRGYQEYLPLQAPVKRALDQLPIEGKRVLDIGCRDGLFSLQAERLGASEVIGIDNDLSAGAVEIVLPFLKSRVKMHALNVYDLKPDTFGAFDIVIFAGVLYHLRYPIWGLKCIRDVMQPGGWLILETGVYLDHTETPLLYCPIDEESPYEPTSISFFNVKGLTDTLSSIGIRVQSSELLGQPVSNVDRGTLVCQFVPEMLHPNQREYWEGLHNLHNTMSPEESFQRIQDTSETIYRKQH
jgi:SAM-dependent methyltransferase